MANRKAGQFPPLYDPPPPRPLAGDAGMATGMAKDADIPVLPSLARPERWAHSKAMHDERHAAGRERVRREHRQKFVNPRAGLEPHEELQTAMPDDLPFPAGLRTVEEEAAAEEVPPAEEAAPETPEAEEED